MATTPRNPVWFGVTVRYVITCSRVAVGSDDAEERPTGTVSPTNSDLELVNDPRWATGGRDAFHGLNIPQGAVIPRVHIEFTADEVKRRTTTL